MDLLKKKTLAIWDFDGTVVDSEPVHMRAYQVVFNKVIPEHPQIDSKYYFQKVASSGGGPQKLIEDFPLPFDLAELKKQKKIIYDGFTQDGSIKMFPEVSEIIMIQRNLGIKVMIASNTDEMTNRQVLKDNNFDPDLIDYYVGPSENMPRKPKPDMFLHSLKISGFEAQDAIVFEDTHIGVEAGVCAGIDTCYLRAEHNEHIETPPGCHDTDRFKLLSAYKAIPA
jgi:beta-phosphoglucomutase